MAQVKFLGTLFGAEIYSDADGDICMGDPRDDDGPSQYLTVRHSGTPDVKALCQQLMEMTQASPLDAVLDAARAAVESGDVDELSDALVAYDCAQEGDDEEPF